MAAMREGGGGLHPPVSPNVVFFNIMIKVRHSWLFQGAKKARTSRVVFLVAPRHCVQKPLACKSCLRLRGRFCARPLSLDVLRVLYTTDRCGWCFFFVLLFFVRDSAVSRCFPPPRSFGCSWVGFINMFGLFRSLRHICRPLCTALT